MPKSLPWPVFALAALAAAATTATLHYRRVHAGAAASKTADNASAPFVQAVTRGNGFFEKGDADQAIAQYTEALKFSPANTDALLNLANACLLAVTGVISVYPFSPKWTPGSLELTALDRKSVV